MTDHEIELVVGGLLHDIGKVIYRKGNDRRKHSQSGYDYLKEIGINDQLVLDCVRYHHGDALRSAKLDDQSSAYIVYIADNIASAADRRENDRSDYGFEMSTPLRPVFNILNGNDGKFYYSSEILNTECEINYPTKEKKVFSESLYARIMTNITDNLKGLELTEAYVNSLLEVMEANLSYVPSSTVKGELADVSLFDHVKLTAAISSCIDQFVKDNRTHNLRQELFVRSEEFYKKDVFLLLSLDVSGIQNFIYTISSEKALRMLRARSFYLEIMMEHIIDLLLEKLNLSRANCIYTGGGHCYLLIPNTKKIRQSVEAFLGEINDWFLNKFQTALYIAGGYAPCSADTLKNVPEGSYSRLFQSVSAMLSENKSHRYSAAQLIGLNHAEKDDYSRECPVCRNIGHLNEDGVCPICSALQRLSGNVLYTDFFTVVVEHDKEGLPLPGGYQLVYDIEASLKRRMQEDPYFVRTYGKNKRYTGKNVSTKLWVGSYTNGNTFEEFAEEAAGIKRIGILRADVDNLGQAFVAGFNNQKNHNRYVTLSRTASLSRQLSLFFKLYINQILSQPEYRLSNEELHPRNVTIVYSGGDDVFIVGAWEEIIKAAVDLKEKFARFTENTLTISAGIGIYPDSYPISASAFEVAEQESSAKMNPGKNSIDLLDDGATHVVHNGSDTQVISDGVYTWDQFEKSVLGEKFAVISRFFDQSEDRGNRFLYNLLALIRERKEKIHFARFVYLLARMEPDERAEQEQKEAYRAFSEKMVQWIQSDQDSRELKTAITLYVYLTRGGEEEQ